MKEDRLSDIEKEQQLLSRDRRPKGLRTIGDVLAQLQAIRDHLVSGGSQKHADPKAWKTMQSQAEQIGRYAQRRVAETSKGKTP